VTLQSYRAGLIKMYALVDAGDYQKVTTGITIEETVEKFTNRGTATTEKETQEPREEFELTAKITDIQNLVLEVYLH